MLTDRSRYVILWGMNAIDIAVKEFGSVNALAASLGVRQSAISNWRARGRVPAERCIVIERVTNGAVSRYQLRPDIFGTPPTSHRQEVSDAA